MAKSQDVVVLLKWFCSRAKKPYSELAADLGMSVGEVHAATRRAVEAGLFDLENARPRIAPLKEYLIHGVKYAFPARRGALGRGMPTSYAGPPLQDYFPTAPGDLPPVWPDPAGTVRGYALEPLFRSVPFAARQDPKLYDLLTLVDALREGRARERNQAGIELGKRLDAKESTSPLSI